MQMLDGGEETLVAVAGMVSCKAQGGVFNSHCVQIAHIPTIYHNTTLC
jgi:hypothetical protein